MPPGNRVDAFAFLADPGDIPFLEIADSTTTPGDLTLSWTHGCSVGAEDHAVYEGGIGDWYSHYRVDCSDGGTDFVEEITPSPGSRTWYGSLTVLVVLPDTTGGERQDSTLAAFIEIQGRARAGLRAGPGVRNR